MSKRERLIEESIITLYKQSNEPMRKELEKEFPALFDNDEEFFEFNNEYKPNLFQGPLYIGRGLQVPQRLRNKSLVVSSYYNMIARNYQGKVILTFTRI